MSAFQCRRDYKVTALGVVTGGLWASAILFINKISVDNLLERGLAFCSILDCSTQIKKQSCQSQNQVMKTLLGTPTFGAARAWRMFVLSFSLFLLREAAAQTFTTLHLFAGGSGDGSQSYAELVQGKDGFLYGTTYGGGDEGHAHAHVCGYRRL